MKIALYLTLIISIVLPGQGLACSAFGTYLDDQFVVAKNFDWIHGDGFVVKNEAGRQRLSFANPNKKSWTSKYQSLSFTTLGPGFPVSGMNEKGLVIESLVNLEQPVKQSRSSQTLISLEWAQYHLDRSASVKEVITATRKKGFGQMLIPLHFFVCDSSGDCAIFEGQGRTVSILRPEDKHKKLLANRQYKTDLAGPSVLLSAGAALNRMLGNHSSVRFNTIRDRLEADQIKAEKDIFETLQDARVVGLNRWQIIWNTAQKTATIKSGSKIRRFSFDGLDFSCQGDVQVMKIGKSKFRSYKKRDLKGVQSRIVDVMKYRVGVVDRSLAKAISAHTLKGQCQSLAQRK